MSTDMFIKFAEVDGEAAEANHENWCEIIGWSHSFSQPASPLRDSTGSTIERANHSDLSITKYLDQATRQLLKAHWNGTQFETVSLDCLRAAGEESVNYLSIEMEDVIISNYSISAGGGDIPVENLSLAYSKITYAYDRKKKQDGDPEGEAQVSHDLKTGVVGE
jgi:type VI secretion system secreted protein Hcp